MVRSPCSLRGRRGNNQAWKSAEARKTITSILRGGINRLSGLGGALVIACGFTEMQLRVKKRIQAE